MMQSSFQKRKREHYSKFSDAAHRGLADAFSKHTQLLADGASTCLPYFEGGSLENLSTYAQRNSAVTGFTLGALFHRILGFASTANQGIKLYAQLPRRSLVKVSFRTANIEQLKQTFRSTRRTVVESSSSGTTKIGSEWEGFGIAFDLDIRWTFYNHANESRDEHFVARIRVEPKAEQRSPIPLSTPPDTEFNLGAVIDLMHSFTRIEGNNRSNIESTTHPCMQPWADLTPEQRANFPRHNPAVEKLEAALKEMARFVDMHTCFLLPFLPGLRSRGTQIAIPWSLVLPVNDQPDLLMDETLSGILSTFLRGQGESMLGHQTPVGNLCQWLVLLKTCAVHFGDCFESIDEFMVRAFFKGIGKHHEVVFEQGLSLDQMLRSIGYHQMDRSGMRLAEINKTYSGCSIGLEMRFNPDAPWERVVALPNEQPKFRGELVFGGIGCEGLQVHGHATRYLFVLPTEAGGEALPQFRLVGSTQFANIPIAVILGTPDGSKTNAGGSAGGIFLFVDGMNFHLALDVAALPSNKAFAKSVSALPPEFASFASAIRACDMANSGIDVHVVQLRPMLAHACGIPVVELSGQREFEGELINLMRAGVSLEALSQRVNPDSEWEEVDSPSGAAGSPTPYNMDLLKRELTQLAKEVYARGAVDNPPPPPPPQVVHQRRRDYAEPVFRSLGAGGGDSEDEEPGFTACGADDAQPADAPAEATSTDAAVDALCDPMKNMATDRDFMKKVMGTLDTLPEPEAIMGAKLAMPNLQASCLFADNIHPKERGGDVKGPEESAYKARANFNSSSDALINLLTSYGQSIPTTRFTVFGCFARWEKGVLTGLMSGSRDPSKLMHEVASKLRPLQAA